MSRARTSPPRGTFPKAWRPQPPAQPRGDGAAQGDASLILLEASGSPTAVLDEASFTDEERCRIPGELGTSHAVFIRATGAERGRPSYSLRFFTAEGELPACGHGTVAALALLAMREGGSALLRAACDRHGLLRCYAYSIPDRHGRAAARMFAPSIGVPEDIANSNSTACLAAHMARFGTDRLTIDMGDLLGNPSTITATIDKTHLEHPVRVGGQATIARTVVRQA